MNTPILKKGIIRILMLGLVIGGAFFLWNRFGRDSKVLRSNPILKKDYELLKHESDSTPVDGVGIALHRLNSYRLPEGKSEAMRRLRDPRAKVRGAVAESLGMHPLVGDVVDAEIQLMSDAEESVRIAAIDAISRSGDSRRLTLLGDSLSRPSLGVRESMAIRGGLAMATQGTERDGHVKALREGIQKSQTDSAALLQGLKLIVRVSPADSDSINLVQDYYQNAATPKEVLPSLYRFLARSRPEFLKKRFLQDVRSGTLPVRVTALNSILELCPLERWVAIQAVLNDAKAESQLKALASRMVGFLGGKIGQNGGMEKPGPGADRCEQRMKKSPQQVAPKVK